MNYSLSSVLHKIKVAPKVKEQCMNLKEFKGGRDDRI